MDSKILQSREQARRERELEEARRAGTAPALKDEAGNDINPHIPQYISKAPWYLNYTAPGLKHQRNRDFIKTSLDTWHRRGVTPHVAIKYRKGACENCGALTHSINNCVERPRKKGAKYTNSNICPDEYIIQSTALGYEAVRDRWAGFDPEAHKVIIDEFKDAEEERVNRKMMRLVERMRSKAVDNDNGADSEDSDGVKVGEFEEADASFGTKDSQTRTTTRNLRIREDTAKYLMNLDINSAFYDPKSRSMREDPLLGVKNTGQHSFRGDNVYYSSGDATKPKEMEVFAWEVQKKGTDAHIIAEPTQLEFAYKEHLEKRKQAKESKRKELIERFGAAEFIEKAKELEPLAKAPVHEEFTRAGKITTTVKLPVISKYEEDLFVLGHSQVWGSFYDCDRDIWGYKCCGITERGRKCTLTNEMAKDQA